MIERGKALTLTALAVFFSSVLSFYAGAAGLFPQLSQRLLPGTAGEAPHSGLDVTRLEQVRKEIQQKFVEPVPTDTLMAGALRGMVNATGDPYSAYYTAEEYQRFLSHFESHFTGIGVHVKLSEETGLVTVVSPIKGSPGDRAGLQADDAIVAVDDQDIRGMDLDKAVALIRGPAGSKVKLTVQRPGVSEPLEFVITRAVIELPSMEHEMLEPGIGYIRIFEFNKEISKRVARALADLRSQGMTRLILDLRGNPGGLLDEAVDVSSLFIPSGKPVVHIVERGGEKTTYSSQGTSAFDLPLVVLVDQASASASEILAGAIKDHGVGVLIGEKTYGKGSVQTFFALPDGAGGLKLTTAKYLTAGGHGINGKGIEPDIAVENPRNVHPGDPDDRQLQEAIRHIKTMKR